MLAGLAVVLGLLYILYAVSRRGLGFLPGNKDGLIRVVEVRSLGPKRGLCLVEVRGRELLLGFGPERIECLAELESTGAASGFAATLERVEKGEPS